jgi:hypothetical protein
VAYSLLHVSAHCCRPVILPPMFEVSDPTHLVNSLDSTMRNEAVRETLGESQMCMLRESWRDSSRTPSQHVVFIMDMVVFR